MPESKTIQIAQKKSVLHSWGKKKKREDANAITRLKTAPKGEEGAWDRCIYQNCTPPGKEGRAEPENFVT